MPRDFGDPNPSDIGDSKPTAPTVNFAETNTRRIGTPDPRVTPHANLFDERVDIREQFQGTRHVWTGTIIERLSATYYSVILQNGKEVEGRDLYEMPDYSFIEAQSVVVIAGQRAGDYQLIGQKFRSGQTVEFAKLTEILEVGSKAKAKYVIRGDELAWEESGYEVTLYDPFYQNYGLITEVMPYTYNVSSQSATIVGSKGLTRLGVASNQITANGHGDVQLHDSTGAVTDAIVDAYASWMASGQTINSGKQVMVQWFIEFNKWIILGKEC